MSHIKLLLRSLLILLVLILQGLADYIRKDHRQDFSLLINFTCAIAKDEHGKNPEMRTIAMVELENNFPHDFSRKILKCLPEDVAKINLNPHYHYFHNNTVMLPIQTLVIFVADKVGRNESFSDWEISEYKNFPVVSHLSKHLIVSSNKADIQASEHIFKELLNIVQIYVEDQKVIAMSFDRAKKLTISKIFESFQQENLSQILFPDKTKNVSKDHIYVVYQAVCYLVDSRNPDRYYSKWNLFLDIIAEKLNASLEYIEVKINCEGKSNEECEIDEENVLIAQSEQGKLDFYLNFDDSFDLNTYNFEYYCLFAPLPGNYSITELILFLPLDKSCWMWLIITITVCTFIWRISEGHWGFPFGAFSFFMGQAQLLIRIRTNRLTMKILLQLLILTFFIFSNGYQSLITSFMLDPVRQKSLKTIDELFESDMKIQYDPDFEFLQGNNPKYQKAKQDGRIGFFQNVDKNEYDSMKDENYAKVDFCSININRINIEGDGKSWRGLYLLPEPLFFQPADLYIRSLHPYLDKFQNIMDLCFAAGLHQAWKLFDTIFFSQVYHNRKQLKTDNEILDFGLIAPFFLILAFGFSAALVAFLCEIFYHDFVSELTKEYFRRKYEEFFGAKIKPRKPKVKRFNVRPQLKLRGDPSNIL